MDSFTQLIAPLFESLGLYSTNNGLGEHLKGMGLDCNDYSRQSTYNLIALYLIVINSLIIINYYYGLFNRIPFNRLQAWLINVLMGAIILLVIAWSYPHQDLTAGAYCKDLKINSSDCAGFAITAAIYSVLWSFLLSMAIKWKSPINKKLPF